MTEFSKEDRNLISASLVKAHKTLKMTEIGKATGIPPVALSIFLSKGILGEERLTALAQWLIESSFLLPIEHPKIIENTTELDIEPELPKFIFAPNAMKHINLSQITSISAKPPRRNDESDFYAHMVTKSKKKVKLYTEWVCDIKMSDGDTVSLRGDEARMFLDFIEQVSIPLKVPVKEIIGESSE